MKLAEGGIVLYKDDHAAFAVGADIVNSNLRYLYTDLSFSLHFWLMQRTCQEEDCFMVLNRSEEEGSHCLVIPLGKLIELPVRTSEILPPSSRLGGWGGHSDYVETYI